MENVERELILKSVPKDLNLKKLYNRHKQLEKEIQRLEPYARYSSSAALEHSKLKKQKLKGKEEIFRLLANLSPQLSY